jgi:hypothetical protein
MVQPTITATSHQRAREHLSKSQPRIERTARGKRINPAAISLGTAGIPGSIAQASLMISLRQILEITRILLYSQ